MKHIVLTETHSGPIQSSRYLRAGKPSSGRGLDMNDGQKIEFLTKACQALCLRQGLLYRHIKLQGTVEGLRHVVSQIVESRELRFADGTIPICYLQTDDKICEHFIRGGGCEIKPDVTRLGTSVQRAWALKINLVLAWPWGSKRAESALLTPALGSPRGWHASIAPLLSPLVAGPRGSE